VAVPPEVNDPPFGEPGSRYASLRDEITARADHASPQYRIDNAKVFELLNEAVTEHKHVKTWIKPFADARDGRGAWAAFKAHYRGSSELEAIEAAAEKRLATLIYRGEKPRYNFETHVSSHRKSHQELEKATGQEMPGTQKVRRLLHSLQAPSMAAAIATIKAIDTLRSDFDGSVNYLRAFLSNNTEHDVRNVSGISGKRKARANQIKSSFDKKKGKTNHPSAGKGLDRYYKPEEWRNLSKETKEKIIELRKKRNVAQVSSEKTSPKTIKWKDPVDDDVDDNSSAELPTSQRSKKKKLGSK
jgi:hypothetical protein